MKLAKFFNHDINNEYFRLYDRDGNTVYHEDPDGYWIKKMLNDGGRVIYCEYLDGFWWKYEFDKNGRKIYCEDSDNGVIFDKRSTYDGKIVEIDGKKYQLKEI